MMTQVGLVRMALAARRSLNFLNFILVIPLFIRGPLRRKFRLLTICVFNLLQGLCLGL